MFPIFNVQIYKFKTTNDKSNIVPKSSVNIHA